MRPVASAQNQDQLLSIADVGDRLPDKTVYDHLYDDYQGYLYKEKKLMVDDVGDRISNPKYEAYSSFDEDELKAYPRKNET